MSDFDSPTSDLFEYELSLPNDVLLERSKRLIGFEARYARIEKEYSLMLYPERLLGWSQKFYGRRIRLCESMADRYPLSIFYGDVGTGKTVAAECSADRLARDLGNEIYLFKLSTKVRGRGKVGQMSAWIDDTFKVIAQQAGKNRAGILIIDEADFLGSSRATDQKHHEDRVGVNTLIQKIDDIRRFGGRILVILCTNLLRAMDPAIVRRAGELMEFSRPSGSERRALIEMYCGDLNLGAGAIDELVAITGPNPQTGRPGFTFSDFCSRLFPQAIKACFPDRAISANAILEQARAMDPSPVMEDGAAIKAEPPAPNPQPKADCPPGWKRPWSKHFRK